MKELFEKTEYPRNYVEFVRKYSYKYGVDENLIFAIIKAESGFDKNAESKAGAIGLMQIMPLTSRSLWALTKAKRKSIKVSIPPCATRRRT